MPTQKNRAHKARSKRKADASKPDAKYTTPYISAGLVKWCTKNKVELKNGFHCKLNDIVICSDGGRDFTNPCVLGKVDFVVPAGSRMPLVGKNGNEHVDGKYGHVFVRCHKKINKGRYKNIAGIV